ncbi:hypothetical protein [Microbacterium excoecariae]|uniref:hypothetical protein n=1 Tax=Microbacterium excoecariae TaxID=2715210 RepID=UPI00140DB0FF|nr:hypothetical protein [Microbacterium excoecariae]NHI16872.1 hypothetical protein [Microbacterium excoecariae]
MTWRFLAQRATSKLWLDMDVTFSSWEGPSFELSGVPSFQATLLPADGQAVATDGRPLFEEWGTLLHVEVAGKIRGSLIVVYSRLEGSTWKIEAAGLSTYPHGIPYDGDYSKIGVDPAKVVAHLWGHVQSKPDSDLGVTVTGDTTPVRLGTPARRDEEAEPYALAWWEAPDIGQEIDALAAEAPFDWVEEHTWGGDDVAHTIRIGYPRLGRRRADLTFTDDANIIAVGDAERSGDDYANEILVIGAGEGEGSARASKAVRDGRLRRAQVVTAKDTASAARLRAIARDELTARQGLLTVPQITVREHPNAPIGSWALGDDIRVQVTLPHLGDIDLWHRVVAWELVTDTTALLSLERSDAYIYGG